MRDEAGPVAGQGGRKVYQRRGVLSVSREAGVEPKVVYEARHLDF